MDILKAVHEMLDDGSHDRLYERGRKLKDRLEKIRVGDLNPTFEEMRHINEVLSIGYGKGANEYHIKEVEKILSVYSAMKECKEGNCNCPMH